MIALIELRLKLLKRAGLAYGEVLLSALLLLLYNPQWLFDVGFQLSYMAVFFILWLYPYFSKKLRSKNRFIDYFSQVTAVSLAVQCGVFALTIFYFHQFSFLFYLGNILFSFLIPFLVVGSLVVIFIAPFSTLNFLTFAFCLVLELFTDAVHWLARWDEVILRDVYINPFMVWGLLGAVLFLFLAIRRHFRLFYTYGFLICGLCCFSGYFWHDFQHTVSQEVVFLKITKRM